MKTNQEPRWEFFLKVRHLKYYKYSYCVIFSKERENLGKNSMILRFRNYKVLTQNQFVTSKRFTFKIIFEPRFEITFFFDKYVFYNAQSQNWESKWQNKLLSSIMKCSWTHWALETALQSPNQGSTQRLVRDYFYIAYQRTPSGAWIPGLNPVWILNDTFFERPYLFWPIEKLEFRISLSFVLETIFPDSIIFLSLRHCQHRDVVNHGQTTTSHCFRTTLT